MKARYSNAFQTILQVFTRISAQYLLRVLQNQQEIKFILNQLTYELLDTLNLPTKWSNRLKLRSKFWKLFGTETGYQLLDERKRLTAAKADELLLVLKHPELPLHNNPAKLAARTMVQRRNISYATQTQQGTKAWDIFMTLVATTRKLGISFFEYMRDRILRIGDIPSLASVIREKSSSHLFRWSWIPE
jgi:hypothetical protein